MLIVASKDVGTPDYDTPRVSAGPPAHVRGIALLHDHEHTRLIESKKMAGIVKTLTKKRTVAGSRASPNSRPFLVEYQCMALSSSLPVASVAA